MGAAAFDVSVVSTAHDVADARLHRLCAAFVRAGLSVEVRGLGSASDAPRGVASVVARPRAGRAGRAVQAVALPWEARGRVVLTVDPDTVPATMLRRALSRFRPGPARYAVVDVHEDYAALLHDRAWARGVVGRAADALVSCASALARRADITVVADEHVPPLAASRRRVVRNLPDGSYLPAWSPRSPEPRAVHIGDLRRSRGLFAMLEALEHAPSWTLDLVGPVAPSDRSELEAWLASSSAAPRVRLHGRLPPRESWAIAAGAWAGLALLEDTPAFRAAVPTKVYEYLGAGLAVVATPLPRTAALVEDAGAGAIVPTGEAAGKVLEAWARDPAPLEAARAAARAWAAEGLGGASAYDELAGEVARLARG
ncbi:glycosyltransferase [Motilibacter deserti]|uniref:Glycosyltransferase family 4 protein n=1 Tax=Motilibacter deserti TaxID=2714956 RepID=A0ABX0GWZ9_9ACTN|nr:glycosyltransferase [Motilibacter deserti]NHC15476.1 glycosyltransferase family 4 protein [Motilibacter deserti]